MLRTKRPGNTSDSPPEMTPKASFKTSTGRRGSLATSRRTPLGTILSVQLYNEALKAHPSIPDEMERAISPPSGGGCARKSTSMARYTPVELVQKATGRGFEPEPFIEYIKAKYSDVYRLSPRID